MAILTLKDHEYVETLAKLNGKSNAWLKLAKRFASEIKDLTPDELEETKAYVEAIKDGCDLSPQEFYDKYHAKNKTILQISVKTPTTIDSREVAEMIGKQHPHLIRDIRGYVEILGKSKIGLSEFFIESNYTSGQNKTLPCYLLTRKGCEFVANKMTGEKGILFTAAYINKFHEMESELQSTAVAVIPEKSHTVDVKTINTMLRLSNQWLKLSKLPVFTDEQKAEYQRKAADVLGSGAVMT